MIAPRLAAGDLVLEQPSVADAPAWAAAQDDECARWFGWPGRPTVERCRAYLATVVAGTEPDARVWAIRRGRELAGGIDLKPLDGAWNVSYFVHPAHRGRGVATRALRLVCAWALAQPGIAAISTNVDVENAASRAVLAKAGFRHLRDVPAGDGRRDAIYGLGAAMWRG